MTTISTFDSADFLTTPGAIKVFMDEAIATNDKMFIAHAWEIVARASSRLGQRLPNQRKPITGKSAQRVRDGG